MRMEVSLRAALKKRNLVDELSGVRETKSRPQIKRDFLPLHPLCVEALMLGGFEENTDVTVRKRTLCCAGVVMRMEDCSGPKRVPPETIERRVRVPWGGARGRVTGCPTYM